MAGDDDKKQQQHGKDERLAQDNDAFIKFWFCIRVGMF